MSGNFLRSDIDRPVLLEIIKTHTDLLFECFGAYEFNNSNLGGSVDTETKEFIEYLQHSPNVILHGRVRPEILAQELRRMDAFFICYDVSKDQSKGTNYHKVMEYLAYGRPIVSNYISSYNMYNENFIMPRTPRLRMSEECFVKLISVLPRWRNSSITVKTYRDLLTKELI
jgi:hypothetical protein